MTIQKKLAAAMTRCGLAPEPEDSLENLLRSMERQVQSLQERVKLQADMIIRRDEEIERVRLEMFKRAQPQNADHGAGYKTTTERGWNVR